MMMILYLNDLLVHMLSPFHGLDLKLMVGEIVAIIIFKEYLDFSHECYWH